MADRKMTVGEYIQSLDDRRKQAADEAFIDWCEYVRQSIEQIYSIAIYNFYTDYHPIKYRRNLSLKQIFEFELDRENIQAKIRFNPEKMTGFRNGYKGEDGLFHQVFELGWHGGADYIDPQKEEKWGKHPNPRGSRESEIPGVPYWRTKTEQHRFGRWFPDDEPAEVADESPWNEIVEEVNANMENYQKEWERLVVEKLRKLL